MGNWFKKEEIKQERRTTKNLKEQLKSPDNKKQAESTSNRNNVNDDTKAHINVNLNVYQTWDK